MGKTVQDYSDDELLAAVGRHGTVAAAARHLGVAQRTMQHHVGALRRGEPRPADTRSKAHNVSDEDLAAALATAGSVEGAARMLDSPATTLRRKARHLGPDDIEKLSGFTPRPLMGLIRVEGNGLCLGDIHLPITRFDIVADAVRSAQEHGCTDWCIIAGDLFNFDALSDYFPKQADHSLDKEIKAGAKLLEILLDVFTRVVVTKGNHDVRVQKAMGYRLRFEHTLRMFLPSLPAEADERLQITGRDYAIVDTPMGEWRVCHTRQYSESPLSVPIKIADVHQQHVIGYHRHHYAVGFSRSGKLVVEGGGAFDTDRTEYLEQWSTTHPRWQPGWVLLHGGRPYLPMLAPVPPLVGG